MRAKTLLCLLAIFAAVSCGPGTSGDAGDSTTAALQKDDEQGLVVPGSRDLDYAAFKVTFIELGADRCIPCKAMQPVMKEIAREFQGVIQVVFFDVWKDPEPARRFGVQMIPTQVFIDPQGNEIARHVGFYAKADLIGMLKSKGII